MALITADKAREIMSASEQRRKEIRESMTREIEQQALRGLNWAYLPQGLSSLEKDWLINELILLDFYMHDTEQKVMW